MQNTYAPPGTVPLVYLAGPYSQGDPVQNTHETVHLATALWESGLLVPVVPHLSLLWHAITPLPYEDWMALDLHLLAKCEAVYRLPGESPGADREVAYAEARGIPVLSDMRSLFAWALAWPSRTYAPNVEVDL